MRVVSPVDYNARIRSKGQTRREMGAQSPRTSEGGGRVAELPRARPGRGPPRVEAQRGPDKRPRGDATPGPDAPKRGLAASAQTSPGGGARDAGAPGETKGSFG